MKNGFIKVAAASPELKVADCQYNIEKIISLSHYAASRGIKILTFPELCVTSSTCGDLFRNKHLITAARESLSRYIEETADLDLISILGLPLVYNGDLYNCATVCHKGSILGIVPKTSVSNNESRTFTSAYSLDGEPIFYNICGGTVPFGTNLRFECQTLKSLSIGINIGIPSLSHPISNASVIAISDSSPEHIGICEHRKSILKAITQASNSACIYANPGYGESTTDLVFSAHNIICENGVLLSESLPFAIDSHTPETERLTVSEIDLELLESESIKNTSSKKTSAYNITFELEVSDTELTRKYPLLPFLSCGNDDNFESNAETVLKIQSAGLKRRTEAACAKKCIIGVSGGLDSTLALLVAVKACDESGRPRSDILAITMPCFGTTNRTKNNAEKLCALLGVDFKAIFIGDSVKSHFKDIGHDINNKNVVFENAQARERTQVLMDIANAEGGIVIGTGDMSELALGWATYNGDHMSMYGVNASLPKTLVRALTKYCADQYAQTGNQDLADILYDIIDTPVSPELLPSDGESIDQKTEDLIGPYEIHDFYMYYMLKYGFSPDKLFRMACHALGSTYSPDTLLKWLKVFIKRFFSQQYKRSCLPDGPSVSFVNLSPRDGLCMPSDASVTIWNDALDKIEQSIK